MKKTIKPKWIGLVNMPVAQEIQKDLLLRQDHQCIYILGGEHEGVLSVGRSLWKDYKNHSHDERTSLPIHFVSRGGKLTIHNPGQLMIYPILNIKFLNMGVKAYLQFLFTVTQKAFLKLGLKTDIDFDTKHGLYVHSKKIVSAGLSYQSGWVSQGLSINLSNDLSVFRNIEVCGQSCMQMTSALEQGTDISTFAFFKLWMEFFTAELNV